MSYIQSLRELLRHTRKSFLDLRTQNILIAEAKKRIRRNQPRLFHEVNVLTERAYSGDIHSIQPILKRCYLRALYRDHDEIRYFLKAHITRWPHESARVLLEEKRQTLEYKANNTKEIPFVTFPLLPPRSVPKVMDILGLDHGERDVLPLPQHGELHALKDQRLNSMLIKVLKLYKFIRATSFIHPRNLTPATVMFPLTVLGDEIAESRKKNIIKKKIAHIRNVFTQIPPLERQDSDYLTRLMDSWDKDFLHNKNAKREYKKFLRRTFIIDQEFRVVINKYAYAQPMIATKEIYFQYVKEAKK